MITTEEMRKLEDSCGLSKLSLMGNAGRGIFGAIKDKFDLKGKKILIICYHGNNGGDGFVAANYLADYCEVDIFFIGDETINENRLVEIAHMMPQRGIISLWG